MPAVESQRQGYRGLDPRECCILRAWLAHHEHDYDRFEYQVRCGPGRDPGEEYDDTTRDMAIKNSQPRADAVVWQGPQAMVIEVKERPDSSALGQLARYGALWRADHPEALPPKLLLVTDQLPTELLYPAAVDGIQVAEVTPDFSRCPSPPPPKATNTL